MAFSSAKEIFDSIPERFDASAAGDLSCVFQVELTGDTAGDYSIAIDNGNCAVTEGKHENPNVSLSLTEETLVGLVNGQVNGIQAYMTGKLKVSGDLMLAQRFQQLFGK